MSEELKPCPWCQTTEHLEPYAERGDKWGAIHCGCGAIGPDVRTHYHENNWHADAWREWNTRAPAWLPIAEIPDSLKFGGDTVILWDMVDKCWEPGEWCEVSKTWRWAIDSRVTICASHFMNHPTPPQEPSDGE